MHHMYSQRDTTTTSLSMHRHYHSDICKNCPCTFYTDQTVLLISTTWLYKNISEQQSTITLSSTISRPLSALHCYQTNKENPAMQLWCGRGWSLRTGLWMKPWLHVHIHVHVITCQVLTDLWYYVWSWNTFCRTGTGLGKLMGLLSKN